MVINPIVGVYIPIMRIPIKGGMTIPNIATFDHGTYIWNPTQVSVFLVGRAALMDFMEFDMLIDVLTASKIAESENRS